MKLKVLWISRCTNESVCLYKVVDTSVCWYNWTWLQFDWGSIFRRSYISSHSCHSSAWSIRGADVQLITIGGSTRLCTVLSIPPDKSLMHWMKFLWVSFLCALIWLFWTEEGISMLNRFSVVVCLLEFSFNMTSIVYLVRLCEKSGVFYNLAFIFWNHSHFALCLSVVGSNCCLQLWNHWEWGRCLSLEYPLLRRRVFTHAVFQHGINRVVGIPLWSSKYVFLQAFHCVRLLARTHRYEVATTRKAANGYHFGIWDDFKWGSVTHNRQPLAQTILFNSGPWGHTRCSSTHTQI